MSTTLKPELYGLTETDLSLVDTNNPTYWWDLDEQSKIDSSNSRFEYINYTPESTVADTTFQQGPSTFTFTIRDKERYLVPSKAFLEIDVTITVVANEYVALNNPCAHVLFDKCRYSINNTVIDRVDQNYPYAALVRGLVNKTRSWMNTQGSMEGWALDGATASGDVNINYNRALTTTMLNYSIIGETSDGGIRNKFTFTGNPAAGGVASVAGVVEQLNLINGAANASSPNWLIQQATNPGFLKRLAYAFPVPGERFFTAEVGTGGVPAQGAGGNLRGDPTATTRTYNLKLPLSEMFAFCRDVKKVFWGYFHTIELTRNQNIHQMVHRQVGATARDLSHIRFDKVELWMPYVKPSDSMGAAMLTRLAKDTVLPLLFNPTRVIKQQFPSPGTNSYTMNWNVGNIEGRPEHIYFFMTHADAEHNGINAMTFTSNFIKSLRLSIGGSQDYPIRELQVNFEEKKTKLAYQMYLDCCGFGDDYTDVALTERDFQKFYPMFCFDLTTSEDNVFMAGKSLIIKAEFRGPDLTNKFISTDDGNANAVANNAAVHIPAFIAYVAVTYRKSGYLSTKSDGIKFISNLL